MQTPSAQTVDPVRLRTAIQASGKTYRELGQAAGCHWSMIGRLANGQKRGCREDVARRLAAEIGVDADKYFIFWVPAVSSDDRRRAVAS